MSINISLLNTTQHLVPSTNWTVLLWFGTIWIAQEILGKNKLKFFLCFNESLCVLDTSFARNFGTPQVGTPQSGTAQVETAQSWNGANLKNEK